MCVGLVLLANCAFFDIFPHKGCKTRPPEFRGNQLMGFQVAWVTCCFMVVATSENGLLERGVGGDMKQPISFDPLKGLTRLLILVKSDEEGRENP